MIFNHQNCLAIARTGCVECNGLGMRTVTTPQKELTSVPCCCALRSIFRSCYGRFRYCVAKQDRIGTVSIETWGTGAGAHRSYGRRNEDYMADFYRVAKQSLAPSDHQIFTWHYLLGADWKLCCRRNGMSRGNFFHTVYRIEEALGRAFAALFPYSLYPVRDYFSDSSLHPAPFSARRVEVVKNVLHPPLRTVVNTPKFETQKFPKAA